MHLKFFDNIAFSGVKKESSFLQLIGEFQLHDLMHETDFHLSRVDAIFVGFYSQLLSLVGEGFGCATHREKLLPS